MAVGAAVAISLFVPHSGFDGFMQSLAANGIGEEFVVWLLPAGVAVALGLVGLSGNKPAAAGGAGAAAAVGACSSILVAFVFESTQAISGFSYGPGFLLQIAAAAGAALVVILGAACAVGNSGRAEIASPRTPVGVAAMGAVAMVVSAGAIFIPEDGVGVFSLPGTMPGAFVFYATVIATTGVIGFASRRPAGAALAFGAAMSPIAIFLTDGLMSVEGGTGFFNNFSSRGIGVFGIGAICAAVCGLIGWAAAASAAQQPAGSRPRAWAPAVGPTSPGGILPAPAAAASPPAWHPDPHGRHHLRYWDGSAWTHHVADASGVVSVDSGDSGDSGETGDDLQATRSIRSARAATPVAGANVGFAPPRGEPTDATPPANVVAPADASTAPADTSADLPWWEQTMAATPTGVSPLPDLPANQDAWWVQSEDPTTAESVAGAGVHGATPPSPGWFPDPQRRHVHRYWDGTQWTQHVADEAGATSIDPC